MPVRPFPNPVAVVKDDNADEELSLLQIRFSYGFLYVKDAKKYVYAHVIT